jgi:hypothetical protein
MARNAIATYLDSLAPEDDVVIESMLTEVKRDKRVLDTRFSEADLFLIRVPNIPPDDSNRISNGKINVKKFEKALLSDTAFVIATEISNVEMRVTNVTITVSPPSGKQMPADEFKTLSDTIKAQISHTVQSFVAGYIPGQDLIYNDLKNAITNLSFGVSFVVAELSVTATSLAKFPPQAANAATPSNMKVRETELAIMKPLPAKNITVNQAAPQS